MRMKRRILSVLLLFLFSATTVFGAEPNVSAQGAALIDGKTGRLLWGRNAEEPMAMASTTKIMTAVLVLENCDLEEIFNKQIDLITVRSIMQDSNMESDLDFRTTVLNERVKLHDVA